MHTIVPIIEGQGERQAVPLLLRRLLHDASVYDVRIDDPVNAHGVGNLSAKLERFLQHAHRRPGCSAIIVIQDGEGACPAELVREHVWRAFEAGCARPVAFVIANRMYESWLVASSGTVMPDSEPFEGDPEVLHSPKVWLDHHMPPGLAYKETTDQAAMTARLDPALARKCRSFRRLEAALSFLLDCVRTGQSGVDPQT